MKALRFKQILSSKKFEIALRFFTYGVMAVSTLLLTTLAIFYAMGYRFNQTSLSIEQGGLVQFRSTPEGATVLVDGKKISAKTPGRAHVSPGSHTVEMQLDGYQTWRRTVDLQPGQLLWLDYTRFVPNSVTTTPIRTFASVVDSAFSPDRRWLLVHEAANSPVYTMFDMSDETKPVVTTITIPDTETTRVNGQLGTFTILEWDFGSHDVLVRHDNGDTHEVIRIDRTKPTEALNISRLFSLNIGEVHFAGGNQNVLYAQTGDVLRRLDVGGASASAALVTGMSHFVLYGEDRIAFVAERELTPGDATSRKAVVGLYQNGKEVTVRTYPAGTQLQVALTEYFRHQYLAISQGDAAVEILQDAADKAIETPVFTRFELDRAVKWLSFSNNGRMLAAGNGSVWATHDLEVAHTYHNKIEDAEPAGPLKWLDDYYLWADAGDRFRMVEFDGQNPRDITGLATGYLASLSQNGKSLFTFSKGAAGVVLQESRLVTQ